RHGVAGIVVQRDDAVLDDLADDEGQVLGRRVVIGEFHQTRFPLGLRLQAANSEASASAAGRIAIQYCPAATSTAVPAQKIELRASAMVETRDATCRRRNIARRMG